MEVLESVREFYETVSEDGRLERGLGVVEGFRTKELLKRFLPTSGWLICDIGGGTGYYSDWLALRGHSVSMLELAPSAVEAVKSRQTVPYEAVGTPGSFPGRTLPLTLRCCLAPSIICSRKQTVFRP